MIKNIFILLLNYLYDLGIYLIFSGTFSNNTENKILSRIIYYYHSIEKGLTNNEIKYKFGKKKIIKLFHLIDIYINRKYNIYSSQFVAACSVLEKYFLLHNQNNIDISDFFPNQKFEEIHKFSSPSIGGTIEFSSHNYFSEKRSQFDLFSNSRRSVRHFNKKLIPLSLITEVIELAKNAPSVCNRQSEKVFFVDDEELTQKILNIQNGINASASTIKQLLIVASDSGAFLSPSERNQMFIDGGVFLQNLLYALHFKGIAACTLNWSKPFSLEYQLRRLLKIKHGLRIISIIAIGYPVEKFKVPYSERKKSNEILEIVYKIDQ